jgi:hypothetical protein
MYLMLMMKNTRKDTRQKPNPAALTFVIAIKGPWVTLKIPFCGATIILLSL